MVELIKGDKLKVKILKQYKKKNIDYTASYLSELLNARFETIRKALEFFYEIGIIEKDVKEHGEKSITYYYLTDLGKILINSAKI